MGIWGIIDYARPIRGFRRLLALCHGPDAVLDGRLEVLTTVAFANWLFQRVLGVNHECPFPVNFGSRITRAEMLSVGKRVVASLAVNGGVYIQAHNRGGRVRLDSWTGFLGDESFVRQLFVPYVV